ncbi:MAG: pyruvate kinase [Clostridia bacterium]|nr:pyruvate kinase [Clostridia bacterium]
MRKTKIVATLGPSCMSYAKLKEMVLAGMNVARINLSHATEETNEFFVKNIKKLRKELNIALPIMIDTRGPEVRVGKFKNDSAEIEKGQTFLFTTRKIVGTEKGVSVNLPTFVESVKVGSKILANDGLLTFKVFEIKDKDIYTIALNSGLISNNKSLFVPNMKLKTPYLNKADMQDIKWAIKNNVELIAASFVNSKNDVNELREFIVSNGGDMRIISKIESQNGVKNLEKIIEVSDGIMVARGDLGVEIAIEKLPHIQKVMIEKAEKKGKVTITATEMLESMRYNPRPTRAEVSDVANAVYDGTSAVMLSGETASGKYPVESVQYMSDITEEAEKNIDYSLRFNACKSSSKETTDVISHSAVNASFVQNSQAIVVFTNSGYSASMISRFKPKAKIIASTTSEKVYDQMSLLWGVKPILMKSVDSIEDMIAYAKVLAQKYAKVKKKENIVIVCGTPKKVGCTNLIKIEQI